MRHGFNTQKHLKKNLHFQRNRCCPPLTVRDIKLAYKAKVRKVIADNATVININIDLVASDHNVYFQFMEERSVFSF